jgi:serine/threonine protein kinase
MGVVWRVHYREWDRELAVKMPLPQLIGSPALKERFVREAETWVGLGVHPHIVQCWFVLSIAGLPSLFLDCKTGGSLKDRLQEGSVAPGQWVLIMEIAMQVTAGLAHAHSRGVVHRDVKPENLLFGADDRICVTDFGLVKTALPDKIERETGLTRGGDTGVSGAGAYLGTPQYGAPEQWGSAERVGPAADIYAFGVMLYEMCCGRRPFDKEGDTSVMLGDLINAHVKLPPPDPREFYPDIPEELVLLCSACLEKEPARRPPSMQAVHQVLSTLHYRLTGARFPNVAALPNTVNPDILNNTAVSLYSLDKRDEARLAWRRGLRLESAHPECLYNLTQLERREGRIGHQEALRRLQQAKVDYPLALICIEQGLSKEAATILAQISTGDQIKKGLVQRALGDALMYTQQYFAAEKAYAQALKLMPNDAATQQRKTAAVLGRREVAGTVLFPSAAPRLTMAPGQPLQRLIVGDDSSFVLAVGGSDFLSIDVETQRVTATVKRLDDARPVERAWIHGKRLLLQEQGAFQLRMLPDLRLVGRKGGRVLAVAPDLSRMVLLTREGATMFSFDTNAFEPIAGADPEPGSHGPFAAFDGSGGKTCLLLATGELAQLDDSLRAVPAEWPSVYEQPPNATALALARDGRVFIGYADGTVNAYDVEKRAQVYTCKLPGPVHGLELAAADQRLLADLRGLKVVLDERGDVLWQGPGPALIEAGGSRLLAFSKGTLQLYELEPFHLSRRWDAAVDSPLGLHLAGDGGLAASWDRSAAVQVWEVYEDHRVYERSQLLSQGQDYDQLVQGAMAFPEAIASTRQALQDGNLLEAYKQLLRARGISGYGQMPEALDLNWALIDKMGRDQIDAVWDRVGVGAHGTAIVDITPSADHLLVVSGRQVSVRLETSSASRILWAHTSKGRVMAARFEEHCVFYVEESGRSVRVGMEDGRQLEEFRLDTGLLVDVHLLEGSVLFVSAAREVGSYDLVSRRVTSKTPSLEKVPQRVLPWFASQAIVLTETECGVVELGKKPGAGLQEFSAKAYKPASRVTYGAHDAKHKVILLGCQDGTLAITDASNGRLLYAIGGVSGAVTGFALVSELAVGIVTTARGQLYYWDMLADKALEGLLAHRGGITSLRVDAPGRYLVTAGKDGQVRLWETSWTASLSLEEKPRLDWLPQDSALSKLARFFRRG